MRYTRYFCVIKNKENEDTNQNKNYRAMDAFHGYLPLTVMNMSSPASMENYQYSSNFLEFLRPLFTDIYKIVSTFYRN